MMMPRKWLLALLAVLFMTPAIAQVIQPIQLQRPVPVKILPQTAQPNDDIADKVMTIEEAKAQIAKLRSERRELNQKLSEAVATIEQMTSRKGSLVRAYCESASLSRNTAGASEECGRYTCGDVDGLCKKSCTVSDDCASGFSCAYSRCMTAEEAQNHQN